MSKGPGSPLIAVPIIIISHIIQSKDTGIQDHNAHVSRAIETLANRKEIDIELIKPNADAKTDEDASPISCRRRRS